MKTIAIIATLALAGCVGAPVTQTTSTVCANLVAARAAEDIALSLATNPATPAELAALKLSRAQMDARCAQVAAQAASGVK